MKLPFFRRKDKEHKHRRITVDFAHQYVVERILYAKPDVTTVPGSYHAVSAKDFESCLTEAQAILAQLDVGVDHAGILDLLLQLQAVQRSIDLLETRVMHVRDAVHLRTDAEADYDRAYARIQLMEEQLQDLDAEIDHLEHTERSYKE